jgi:aspartyl-tRNA(Asn)/glutamyl-tRNA(Gln) amidotransferase subunit A
MSTHAERDGGDLPPTLTDAAAALRTRTVSSAELLTAVTARADAHDEELGAYLLRFDEHAPTGAAQADADFAAGIDRGPLQGIPVAVKDILAVAEGPTTGQSLVLDPAWGAGRDADVVSRLKAAGAVITGKTSTMELAIGVPDAAKPFPLPRNPWDPERWSGGSSSGSASAVAAGFAYAAVGTDTAGSIRIPAAFCGVSGLMPTSGSVPAGGCLPVAWSLDHIGPLARSAVDCGAMLATMADAGATAPFHDDLRGITIGVVHDRHFGEDRDDRAARPAFDAAVAELERLGAHVVEAVLPQYEATIAAMWVTMVSEALAFHRDGLADRWEDHFRSTRHILAAGALVSGAEYVQAQRVRRVTQRALADRFDRVDVLTARLAHGLHDGDLRGAGDPHGATLEQLALSATSLAELIPRLEGALAPLLGAVRIGIAVFDDQRSVRQSVPGSLEPGTFPYMISAPLLVDGRPAGLLHIGRADAPLSTAERDRCNAAIPGIAIAVESTRMLMRLTLQRRVDAVLTQEAVAIASGTESKATLRERLEDLRLLFGASVLALVPSGCDAVVAQDPDVAPSAVQRLVDDARDEDEERVMLRGRGMTEDGGFSTLYVPARLGTQLVGTLATVRPQRLPFTAEERHGLLRMADLIALSWAWGRYQQHRAALARLEERERIADDLHDDVVQILFGAQMQLDELLDLESLPDEARARATQARTLLIGEIPRSGTSSRGSPGPSPPACPSASTSWPRASTTSSSRRCSSRSPPRPRPSAAFAARSPTPSFAPRARPWSTRSSTPARAA